jgi:hypothetical protein
MSYQEYIIIGLSIWLLVLSALVGWVINYFRALSKGVEKKNLIKVLERVLTKQKDVSKALTKVRKQISDLESDGQLHIQKVGVVRFNPFSEMGGDHSFSLALLDGQDKGFVVTGLHTRERTRVYLKEIKKGKSNLELSKEEKKALKLAQKS